MPNDSKHIQASLSLIPTDWSCLRVAQLPRCRDLALFVVTTDRRADGQTDRLLYPCTCMRGKYMEQSSSRAEQTGPDQCTKPQNGPDS